VVEKVIGSQFGGCAIAITLFLVACADPKYVARDARPIAGQKVEAERTEFPLTKTSIWLTWEKFPTNEDFGSLLLKFGRENLADKSIIPQDIQGEVEVELWMPSMGHGSSPVTVTRMDTGTYRASQVFFTMPGDWEIRIQRLVNGVVVEQAVIALRF